MSNIKLKEWQNEAYHKFIDNKYRGVVCAATGSGKTFLGLKFIEDFSNETFLICTPTIVLLEQWKNKINWMGKFCGVVYSGRKQFKPITIAVINSVRNVVLSFNNVILDECHHYLSLKNRKLFELNNFKKILALSATIDSDAYKSLGLDILYNYEQCHAIENKDLCKYKVINVAVDFFTVERMQYKRADETIKQLFKVFNYDFSKVYQPPFSKDKYKLQRAINTRRQLMMNALAKVNKCIEIVTKNQNKKIMIFCEYIKTANLLYRKFMQHNINTAMYHSKSKNKAEIIEAFKKDLKILISVRALDEGVDVPDADMAIILAGNNTSRQIIQRVGRVLRYKDKVAVLYQFYVRGTKEEQYIKNRLKNMSGYGEVQWQW